jgi:hypothetical protein
VSKTQDELRSKLERFLATNLLTEQRTTGPINDLETALCNSIRTIGEPEVSREVVSILSDELDRLEWTPFSGASFVGAALRAGVRGISFLQLAKAYVSLYFQEQDERLGVVQAWLDSNEDGDAEVPFAILAEAVDCVLASYARMDDSGSFE